MVYILRNGLKVNIREIQEGDAKNFIELLKITHAESKFLGSSDDEVDITIEEEIEKIKEIRTDDKIEIFVAEIDDKIVGHVSVSVVRNRVRYLHRARIGIMILKDYTGMGIGGKLMSEMINWCNTRSPKIEQIELEIVIGNEIAYNMYRNFGFVEYGKLANAFKYPDGTYADQYFMVKYLNDNK
ncbi:MAG: GNAT family N-acetyltransferase [Clostridia bacterium]|nr:GNAT family N-acetyltransferase [Clostridia bacterium]